MKIVYKIVEGKYKDRLAQNQTPLLLLIFSLLEELYSLVI